MLGGKIDWGLVLGGVLMAILGCICMFYPGLTLVTIALMAGALFLVSGVFDIIAFVRMRGSVHFSGWAIAYAILDIILGAMFLAQPIALAGVIPWMCGIFFAVFGLFEIIGCFKVRKDSLPMWGFMLFSGIVSLLCGICFFAAPASFAIFVAVFCLMRGISMFFYGISVGKYKEE